MKQAHHAMAEKYTDLDPAVRAFLESMGPEHVGDLHAGFRFYGRLPEASKKFLTNAKPATLEWLTEAREEEIEKLDKTIRLANASTTVGKFIAWAIGIFAGMFFAAAQFGDAIVKVLTLLKGGVIR
jgi:hypothetical protein